MPEYRVIWEIDLAADSPEEAARLASKIQYEQYLALEQDGSNDALPGVFEIQEPGGDHITVDLAATEKAKE